MKIAANTRERGAWRAQIASFRLIARDTFPASRVVRYRSLYGVVAGCDATSEVLERSQACCRHRPAHSSNSASRRAPACLTPQLREDGGDDRGGGLEGENVLIIYHQLWAENSNHGGMFERMTDLVWTAHELGATVRAHDLCFSLLARGVGVFRRR